MRILVLFLLFFIDVGIGYSQGLLQSKEISVRNDLYYNIINLEGTHLILRKKPNQIVVESFNNKLEFQKNIELDISERKYHLDAVVNKYNTFQLYYSYFDGESEIVSVIEYDQFLAEKDSTVDLLSTSEQLIKGNYKFSASNDNSKLVLFGTTSTELIILLIDTDTKAILLNTSILLSEYDLRDDFIGLEVSNNGVVYIVFEKDNNKYERESHTIGLYRLINDTEFEYINYDLSNTLNTGLEIAINDQLELLTIAGLYSEKEDDEIIGYLILNLSEGSNSNDFVFNQFDDQLFNDVYSQKGKRNNRFLSDYSIKDIVHNQNGGCLLVSELSKEFVRRSSYTSMPGFENSPNSLNGFVDYYHEDMLLISVDKDVQEKWYKLFYKKQFSQDDLGVFSSFFLFKSPSRVRLIYNDEIKKNNTVSEYIVSPTGKFERNAIVNTEYKDLQLRFKNAEQISSNTFIVPSESNFKLSLVKINI